MQPPTSMQLASFFSGENVEQEGGYVVQRDEDWLNQGRESLVIAGQSFVCRKCHWNCDSKKDDAKTTAATPTRTIRLVPGSGAWLRAKELVDKTAADNLKLEERPAPLVFAKVDSNSFQYKISTVWSKGRPGSLDKLNEDVLLHIILYLDTSSLLVFGSLYRRFGKLLEGSNVRTFVYLTPCMH